MTTTAEKFEQWAIVELMGHAHIAGKVTEETRFGTVLMRVDVPALEDTAAFTTYFGGSAIYRMTPCDEATVLRYVKNYAPKPISIYVPQPQQPQLQMISGSVPHEEEDNAVGYGDDFNEDEFDESDDFDSSDDDGDYDDYDLDDEESDEAETTDDYDPMYDPDFVIDPETLAAVDEDNVLDILESAYPEHDSGMMPLPTADATIPEGNPLSLYEEHEEPIDDITIPLDKLEIVHVIRVQRKASKGSGSPSWEMDTVEGKRFWVFSHEKNERNTWVFFRDAGYGDFLSRMRLDDVQRWQKFPIEATIIKDGDFYKPILVTHRPVLAKPDDMNNYWPQRRIDVVNKARSLTTGLIVDVESTGTSTSDVITEFACMNLATGAVFETLIRPKDINIVNVPSSSGKKPSDINGITVEMLKNAPTIEEVAEQIYIWTEGQTLIGHQIEFDIRLINQSLIAAGLDAIKPKDSICTMHDLMDKFVGDPFGDNERFRWQTLHDSAIYLGITPHLAHRAMADVRTTAKVILGLASLEPSTKVDSDYTELERQTF